MFTHICSHVTEYIPVAVTLEMLRYTSKGIKLALDNVTVSDNEPSLS